MKDWFCRTFTPWRAAALFEDGDAWFAYLVRYDKVCNAIRVVLFAVAALMLIAGYAMTDDVAYAHPWYTIALAAVVPAIFDQPSDRAERKTAAQRLAAEIKDALRASF